MARMYSEEDIKIEEARILRQRAAFNSKTDREKERIKKMEGNAAKVTKLLNDALDLTESNEISDINLRGRHGEIMRVPDASTVHAETAQGDAVFLTPGERFNLSLVLNAKQTLEMPWTFTFEDGKKVETTIHAKTKLNFYVDGKKVQDEDLTKKLSDWREELGKRANRDINLARIEKGIDLGEEARKRFLERTQNKDTKGVDR